MTEGVGRARLHRLYLALFCPLVYTLFLISQLLSHSQFATLCEASEDVLSPRFGRSGLRLSLVREHTPRGAPSKNRPTEC